MASNDAPDSRCSIPFYRTRHLVRGISYILCVDVAGFQINAVDVIHYPFTERSQAW